MTIPRSASYVVVGAGIHGLSTAYHLAQELRTRGLGSGADIVVLDKSRPGRGSVRDRLRRRPEQLLPAGDERAHAGVRRGVGVGSRCVRLQPGRLHRARRLGPGGGPDRDVRAAGAHRLRLRADPRRGRGRRAHEGALPRLARPGRHGLPAREAGRVRVQPRLGRGACRQVQIRGRRDAERRRGDRVRGSRRRDGHSGRDERGPDRGRRASRRRARPVGATVLERCSASRRRSTSARRRAR